MKIIYVGADVGFDAVTEEVAGRAEVLHIKAERSELEEAIQGADAMLDASMKVHITDEMIDSAPNLKIISCATTGSDHIQRKSADARDIDILTLKDDRELLRNITPAAEHTWALLMACARKIPSSLAHVRDGGWTRELFPGFMLKDKRIGIIGCGRIGGWVSRYATAFGMDVVGYDPYSDDFPDGVQKVSLDELFSTSDVITAHVHLTDETNGMLSSEYFGNVKQGAIFINTSRGAITDESALLNALVEGRLSAAGLDVLIGEPEIANHPLVEYARNNENLIITPHCGGFSPDAVAIVCRHAVSKILNKLV